MSQLEALFITAGQSILYLMHVVSNADVLCFICSDNYFSAHEYYAQTQCSDSAKGLT